jgi:hypothetical protein
VDVNAITERALADRTLVTISDCPEYWMYEALTHNRDLFSQKGALKLGLMQSGEQLPEERKVWKMSRQPESVSALAQTAYEAQVEAALVEDLNVIEPGMRLIGRQYNAPPVGRLDLLCEDRDGNLVVIEIKALTANTNSVVQQTAAYVGWVRERMARPKQKVRGIIIGGKPSPKLAYAVKAVPNLALKCFSMDVRDYDLNLSSVRMGWRWRTRERFLRRVSRRRGDRTGWQRSDRGFR